MLKQLKFSKLFLSLLFLAGVAISTFSFTKAYFADTEVSTGNLFSVETINLQVGDTDPSTYNFIFDDLRPGKVKERTVAVHNIGGFGANFSMEFSHDTSLEGATAESETDKDGEGDLDDCVELRVVFDNSSVNEQVMFDWSYLPDIENKIHNEAWQDGQIDYWVNTRVANMTIQARADSCGNEVFGDTFLMNLTFHLDQLYPEDFT